MNHLCPTYPERCYWCNPFEPYFTPHPPYVFTVPYLPFQLSAEDVDRIARRLAHWLQPARCHITGNPVGTDTVTCDEDGNPIPCECPGCKC